MFYFFFSLLQNSTSISKFNEILFHFYNIFSQRYFNESLIKSLYKIQFEIKTRKETWLQNSFQYKERNYLNKCEELRKEIVFANDISDNYKRDSPFTKYFDDRLKELNQIIKKSIKFLMNQIQ